MAEQFIYEKNGITMRYATFGQGESTVVIIPGISLKNVTFMADSIEARYNIPEYAGKCKFYVFDQREDHFSDYSILDMADDLSIVMGELGLVQSNIIGVSMGGMVALAMAAYHSEFVRKLCLVSSAVTVPETLKKILTDWIGFGRKHDARGLAECFVDHVYSENTLRTYREAIIRGCLDATDKELDNFAIRSGAIRNWDFSKEVGKIIAPAYVIASRGDRLCGYECAIRNGELLGCEVYLYGEEYGHAVYDEAPDFVEKALNLLMKNPHADCRLRHHI